MIELKNVYRIPIAFATNRFRPPSHEYPWLEDKIQGYRPIIEIRKVLRFIVNTPKRCDVPVAWRVA